ncbi:MAG: hypothetical protein KGJ62_07545 [Armatimonadetes bacterium]|nr:hypothetical protein [Armatimonadota bacterium]
MRNRSLFIHIWRLDITFRRRGPRQRPAFTARKTVYPAPKTPLAFDYPIPHVTCVTLLLPGFDIRVAYHKCRSSDAAALSTWLSEHHPGS